MHSEYIIAIAICATIYLLARLLVRTGTSDELARGIAHDSISEVRSILIVKSHHLSKKQIHEAEVWLAEKSP